MSQAIHIHYETILLMKKTLVIGSQGSIGRALCIALEQNSDVYTISRKSCDYSEAALKEIAQDIARKGSLQQIYCCIGVLHNDILSPEKSLAQLEAEKLIEYFRINTVLPALCLKYFSPLLDKNQDSQFVLLSAMVGSIEDNKLGGWYGYRSSKSALNMLAKTAAIELTRSNKKASVVVIHPGTTQGDLSKPFASSITKDKYYTAEDSAQRVIDVANNLSSQQTGQFFNWDGTNLAW